MLADHIADIEQPSTVSGIRLVGYVLPLVGYVCERHEAEGAEFILTGIVVVGD